MTFLLGIITVVEITFPTAGSKKKLIRLLIYVYKNKMAKTEEDKLTY